MRFLRLYYNRFNHDETARLAAALSFYTLFALAPFLLLLTTIASFLGLGERIALTTQVRMLVSPEAAEAVRVIVSAVSTRTELTSLVGIVSALAWAFSASLLIAESRASLTRVFAGADSRRPKPVLQDAIEYIKTRLLSLVLVFVFTLIVLISLVASSYLAFYVRHHPAFYIRGINLISSFIVYFVVFATAYLYLPKCRVSFRRATLGALITAGLFVVGKELIGLYLGRTAFGSAYGAVGSVVILLCWVYYSCIVLFAGAQLTTMLDYFSGSKYSVSMASPSSL